MVKNPPSNAGDRGSQVQSLGWEDRLEEEMANPLQCSCLENPKDRGAWQAAVYGVTNSWNTTERAHTHTHLSICIFKCDQQTPERTRLLFSKNSYSVSLTEDP